MSGPKEPSKPTKEASSDSFGTSAEPEQKRVIAGRYQISGRLGRGAAGIVFAAIDLHQENLPVAIKVLSPLDLKDPTAITRFEREVTLTREFNHPNLVKVFDFGTMPNGNLYIVMEMVAGGTLSRKIYDKKKPLSFSEAGFILLDIIRGVGAAHEVGVVHRDLKPDNILLTIDGKAKVADFGLAREALGGNTITHSADTVGTPYYMAPEQFRNHRVDQRADIYSLGIIAFEMINRKRPFQFEVYTDLARAHMLQPTPSFHGKQKGVPRWFETFVFACTEKNPESRFTTMQDAEKFLERKLGKMKVLDRSVSGREPFLARIMGSLLGENR